MAEAKIPGGFYLKARKTQESWIAHAPPHVREIWDWLLMKANWQDSNVCKRGQLLTSYKEIRDGLHWMVGWRKQKYSKNDCETTMNMLKKHTMITTAKTTRGMFVTILNFNIYQNPKNYEPCKETYRNHTVVIQTADTILEEVEEVEEVNRIPNGILSGNGEKPACLTPVAAIPYLAIIQHLNQTCGSKYLASTQSYRRHIKARWNDGLRFQDFVSVIDLKFKEWGTDEKMVKFLRPETLFGTKMPTYLGCTKEAKGSRWSGNDTGRF